MACVMDASRMVDKCTRCSDYGNERKFCHGSPTMTLMLDLS